MSKTLYRKPGIIEIVLGWAFKYEVFQYHDEYTLILSFIFITFYIGLPNFGYDYDNWDRSWGVYYHNNSFWFHWGNKGKSIRMPWDWELVRHDIMFTDGFKKPSGNSWDIKDGRVVEIYPYSYILKNGTIQERLATIYEEEREWRWLWLQWLTFPRLIQHSINVEFDGEVGERTGSWKGGTIGCGYTMLPGETMKECLSRMERERTFN